MFSKKYTPIALAFLLTAVIKTQAQLDKTLVLPLQTGHYSPGLMNILDEADPAPVSGLMILDYNTVQYGNRFYGKNGKQITQITGPSGKLVNLNADVSYVRTINIYLTDEYYERPLIGHATFVGIIKMSSPA